MKQINNKINKLPAVCFFVIGAGVVFGAAFVFGVNLCPGVGVCGGVGDFGFGGTW